MNDVIQEKLKAYNCETKEDEENAIKEITQEVILYGLGKAGLFEKAAFQGGTCLRIIHGLDRFSEDLDFALRTPDPDFEMSHYLDKIATTMSEYGYKIEVSGEEKAHSNIKTRFIKDDSIKRLLNLQHLQDLRKKIQIKIEIDINPPDGAGTESNYVDFPIDFMVITHDKPSLLAGKCHALLCRNYTKGRDWYDYLWHIRHGTVANLEMLQHALDQQGPWKGKAVTINKPWLKTELARKIKSINWRDLKNDVSNFIRHDKQEALELWSEDFFLKKTDKLK